MLYQTSIKFTYEEYKRFSLTIMKKALTKTAIGLLILLLFAAILLGMDNFKLAALLCAFIPIYIFMLVVKVNKQIKRT